MIQKVTVIVDLIVDEEQGLGWEQADELARRVLIQGDRDGVDVYTRAVRLELVDDE